MELEFIKIPSVETFRKMDKNFFEVYRCDIFFNTKEFASYISKININGLLDSQFFYYQNTVLGAQVVFGRLKPITSVGLLIAASKEMRMSDNATFDMVAGMEDLVGKAKKNAKGDDIVLLEYEQAKLLDIKGMLISDEMERLKIDRLLTKDHLRQVVTGITIYLMDGKDWAIEYVSGCLNVRSVRECHVSLHGSTLEDIANLSAIYDMLKLYANLREMRKENK